MIKVKRTAAVLLICASLLTGSVLGGCRSSQVSDSEEIATSSQDGSNITKLSDDEDNEGTVLGESNPGQLSGIEVNGVSNAGCCYYNYDVYYALGSHVVRTKDLGEPMWDLPTEEGQYEEVLDLKEYCEDVKELVQDIDTVKSEEYDVDQILISNDILYCNVSRIVECTVNDQDGSGSSATKRFIYIIAFDLNENRFINKIVYSDIEKSDFLRLYLDGDQLYIASHSRLTSLHEDLSPDQVYADGIGEDQWKDNSPWESINNGYYPWESDRYIDDDIEMYGAVLYNGYVYYVIYDPDNDYGTSEDEGLYRRNIETDETEKIFEVESPDKGFIAYEGDSHCSWPNICNNKLYLNVSYYSDYESEDSVIANAVQVYEIDLDSLEKKVLGVHEGGDMSIVNGNIVWKTEKQTNTAGEISED